MSNAEQAIWLMLKIERKTFKEKMGNHLTQGVGGSGGWEWTTILLENTLSSVVGEIRHGGDAAAVTDVHTHGEALCSPHRGDQRAS